MEYFKVCEVGDIEPGTGRCFNVEGELVSVFNSEGEFYAVADTCTHADASLADGELFGEEIECPLHFARFNLKTGAATAPPAHEDLKTYLVRVRNGEVEVAIK